MPDLGSSTPSAPGSSGPGMSTLGEIGTGAAAAGNLMSIYSGLNRGGVTGYGSAALSAANLANNTYKLANNGAPLISGPAGGALGAAGGALSIYSGLKQGGAVGDIQAGLGAVQAAAGIGTLAGGAAAGGLGSLASLGAFANPVGLALAPVLMGMESPAYTLNSQYWNGMMDTINTGGSAGNKGGDNAALYDAYTPQAVQVNNAVQQLYQLQQSGQLGGAPADVQQWVAQNLNPSNALQTLNRYAQAANAAPVPGGGKKV